MDSYNLDFNIDNYTVSELINFLGISNNNITRDTLNKCVASKKNGINSVTGDAFDVFMNNVITKIMNSLPNNDNTITRVNEYKFPPGVVNHIERQTIKKTISIDSLFRTDYVRGASSDFTWKLPSTEHNVISLKLSSVELPLIWYNISDKNGSNKFQISLKNVTEEPDSSYVIAIPSGNYSSDQMALAINNVMENVGVKYIAFEISELTGNSIFRIKTAQDNDANSSDNADITDPSDNQYSPDFYYELNFNIGDFSVCNSLKQRGINAKYPSTTLGAYLGFLKLQYTTHLNDTYNDYITQYPMITYNGYIHSETAFGNRRSSYVFISINDFVQNSIVSSVIATEQELSLGNDILGRVSITDTHNAIMINNASDHIYKQRDYMGPVALNNFNIKLLNRYGEVIDLNGNDFSLSLEITCLLSSKN